jgi:hypothetical protein
MPQAMRVLTSRATDEWYTPPNYIEMARTVLGDIDCDPASAELPQTWIKAAQYYTAADDGRIQSWQGRVFLNPPFDDTAWWARRLVRDYLHGDVTSAVLLVNSNLGYKWYEELWTRWPVCCVRERICFVKEDGTPGGQAKRGQTFVYFGHDFRAFQDVFYPTGRIILP